MHDEPLNSVDASHERLQPLDYETPQTSRDKPQKTRMTLVEFLIVLGIIAVLIGILLPALNGRGHPPSRAVMCMSNLRQLATAMILYANNNGGQFPDSLDTIACSKYLSPIYAGQVLVCPMCKDTVATAPTPQQLVQAINSKPRPEAYAPTAPRPPGHVSYIYVGNGL